MKSGRILIALLIVAGIAGAFATGAPIYSRFLALGILIVILSAGWSWLALRSLRLSRQARSLRANVGDIFEELFEVSNRGWLVNLWIEILNESKIPNVSGSRLLTLVGGRQKRSYTARTWLTQRGAFALGPTSTIVGDIFGLFRFRRSFPAADTIIVMPMIFDLTKFVSPPGLLPGGQVIRRKAPDVTPHAAGVREYMAGDPMKRIHWPTSIRRGQLMVKEFEQDPQAEIWLFLDAQKKAHSRIPYRMENQKSAALLFKVDAFLFGHHPEFHLPPSTIEYAVSIVASLSHYLLDQRRSVGLVTSGRALTTIPAERSERQEGKILETLAFVEPESPLSLAGLVASQAQQLPQGSSAILVTPTVSPDLLVAVDDLQRRALRPVVVLLISETFGGPRGSDRLMRSLAERNIPFCPIYCDADLSSALGSFANKSFTQDSILWQRPPLPHLT